MAQTGKKYEIDMCSGALLPKMLRFALPLMFSGILQLFFNAADIIILGRFAGSTALAAVGSTGTLINLLINAFMGLSVGTNVLAARYMGAGDAKNVGETVHTSVLISLVCGTGMIFIGILFAEPLLKLMGTPSDVIGQAVLYMRIYFLSMPALMLYNFGSAILRAVGDTRRPLYFLTASGVLNVILNLIFVIGCDWGVAGVAAATSFSQTLSALLVLLCLMREKGIYRVSLKSLRIYKDKLLEMIRIGLPAGIQSCLLNISGALIQSSVNSFGSAAMAGNAAASNIEGFVWTAMNSIAQTTLSFTSQNAGGRKYSRIGHINLLGLAIVTTVGILLGGGAYLFSNPLLHIYNSDPEVIAAGIQRMLFISLPYFLCGIKDVMCGSMRGLGYSMLPTLVSFGESCVFRVLWVLTVFRWHRTLGTLFVSYPVSWIIAFAIHVICFMMAKKKLPSKDIPVLQADSQGR